MDILNKTELEQLMRKEEQQVCFNLYADPSNWRGNPAGSNSVEKPAQRG